MAATQQQARAGATAQYENRRLSLDEVVEQTTRALGDRRFQKRVENILPGDAGMEVPRFVALALATVTTSEALLKCSLDSIERAVLQAAQLGLEIGGPRQHAALVPYKGECVLVPMYKGKIYLGVKAGAFRDVRARVVYEGDEFDAQFGDDEYIRHTPRFQTRDPNAITHAYAVVTLPDGTLKRELMAREEIDYIRQTFSRQADGQMWTKSYEEACKKTVIHRALKTVPTGADLPSQRFADALELAGRAEGIYGGALSSETMDEIIARTTERITAAQGASRTEGVLAKIRGEVTTAQTEREPGEDDEQTSAL